MARLSREGGVLPELAELTSSLTAGLTDPATRANALRGWIDSVWLRAEDPVELELVRSVPTMLARLDSHGRVWGDCDDAAVFAAASLLSVGLTPEFLLLDWGAGPEHVLTWHPGTGIRFDPTRPPNAIAPSGTVRVPLFRS